MATFSIVEKKTGHDLELYHIEASRGQVGFLFVFICKKYKNTV